MDEGITYSYATTINERIKAWRTIKEPIEQQQAYNNWLLRKSLLTTNDYSRFFQCNHLNEKRFSKGLLPFTEERARLLLPIVKASDWFMLHQKLFQQECPIKEYDLKAALRFHLAYYESYVHACLAEQSVVQFSNESIVQLKQQVLDELFYIAQKSLVWDVHQMVEEQSLQSTSKEEEFRKYIEECLGDAQRTFLLYGEYPALARVLSIRLTFACEAIKEFILALTEGANQLVSVFSATLPLRLTAINIGQGDSHDEGKTVIHFCIEKQAFIFKPKNLMISQRFNKLLSFLETLDPDLCFYKIQRLVFSTFTIEESVICQECTNTEEITTYYQRYGQLLAIVYWLGTTDLHMENLIAKGDFPVLIDLETLIQPNLFQQATKTARQNRMERNSVLISGLVPTKYTKKAGITFDALSGKQQKLSKKVRRLQKKQSSEISFQLEDGYMSGAQNQPRLNGAAIDYRQYCRAIETSFKKMNTLFLAHKPMIIEKIKELFADVKIRLIYRDTQIYSDMLDFSVHVDCMSNYIEREKVISNLWANQLIPEAIVPFEAKALLVQDIPYFTANTSKTTVSIAGNEIPNVLSESPLAVTVLRLEQLDEVTCNFSFELLKESLHTLEYRLQKIYLPKQNQLLASPLLSKAADIGDTIQANLFINQNEKVIDWLSVSPTKKGQPTLKYPQKDLYAGSGGLYLFFICLNRLVPKKEYQELLFCWEQEIFSENPEEDETEGRLSAFFGIGSCLLIAFYGWQLTGEEKYQNQLKRLLGKLTTLSLVDNQQPIDWLTGLASLVAVLAAIYRVCQDSVSRDLLTTFTLKIDYQEMENNSFAHGYAGVLYALQQSNQLLNDQHVQAQIDWYLERFEGMRRLERTKGETSWCRNDRWKTDQLQLETTERFYEQLRENEKNDSCICHGLYGQIDNDLASIQLLIDQPVYLKGDDNYPPLGLFCGLSGVGYQYLRAYDPLKIKSIVFIK